MRLDPPESPLGMLQRGRGAGYLWALGAPREEAWAALLRCIVEDPRRDWQLDDLGPWYAEIAEAVDFDPRALEPCLFGPGLDPDPVVAREAVELALGVVLHLVRRRGPGAAVGGEILARYVARGTHWKYLVECLALRIAWREASPAPLPGIAQALSDRFPVDGDLRAALADLGDLRDGFTRGPLRHPRLAAAVVTGPGPRLPPPPAGPPLPEDLAGVALADLLREAAKGPVPQGVAEALDLRRTPEDLAALRAILQDADQPPPLRVAAMTVLGRRGDAAILPVAESLLQVELRPRFARSRIFMAVDSLPAPLVLPWARARYRDPNFSVQIAAASVLGKHAGPEDLPLLASGLDRILGGDEPACACEETDGLVRIGNAEARRHLRRVFEGTSCFLNREDAFLGLEKAPGGLPEDLAAESLWDASDTLRAEGARVAPLRAPGVRERMEGLAARDPEEEDAARVAAGRLAAEAAPG